jgi:uncharacterized Ntn-hydrolase superfamily protein
MTWSLIARDAAGRFGIAIASRFFAVGALCAHTRRGVGAVATQALSNPLYGPQGLDRLAAGDAPEAVVHALITADAGREQRQVHVLGARGAAAAHTGGECIGWCGHFVEDGWSVAGNMLAGPEVLEATADAFRRSAGRPLAERLIEALAAGEAAGGDKRGKQSAAVRIQGDEDRLEFDLRVDDAEEPVVELRRLYAKSFERFQAFVSCLPGRRDPNGIIDRQAIEASIERFQSDHAAEAEAAARSAADAAAALRRDAGAGGGSGERGKGGA